MSIAPRLVAAVALLLGLVLLEAMTGEWFTLIVGIVLLSLPLLQWAAVYFFGRRAVENPDITPLRARRDDALALAMVSTMAAFLGLLVVLRAVSWIGPVPRQVFLIGLAYALILVAAPAVNWLLTWRPWKPVREGAGQ